MDNRPEPEEQAENIPPEAMTSKLKFQSNGTEQQENGTLLKTCICSTPAPSENKSRLSGVLSTLSPILKYLKIENKQSPPPTVKCASSSSCLKSTGKSAHHSSFNLSTSHSGTPFGATHQPYCLLDFECLPEITLLDDTNNATIQLTTNDSAYPQSTRLAPKPDAVTCKKESNANSPACPPQPAGTQKHKIVELSEMKGVQMSYEDLGQNVTQDIMQDLAQDIIQDVELDMAQDKTQDIMQDVELDMAQDKTQDIMQDVELDMAQDIMQDVELDVAQDKTQDIMQDVKLDVAQDIMQDVAQDKTQDIMQDVAQDKTQDIMQDVAQDKTQDIMQDVAQDKTQDLMQDVELDVAQDKTQDIMQDVKLDVVQDKTQDIMQDVAQDKTQDIMQDVELDVAQDKTQDIMQDVKLDVVQDKTQDIIQDVVQDKTQDLAQDMVHNKTQDIMQDVELNRAHDKTQDIMQDVVQDKTQDLAQDMVHNKTQDIMQDVELNRAHDKTQDIMQDVELDVMQDLAQDIMQDVELGSTQDKMQDLTQNKTQDIVHNKTQDIKQDVLQNKYQDLVQEMVKPQVSADDGPISLQNDTFDCKLVSDQNGTITLSEMGFKETSRGTLLQADSPKVCNVTTNLNVDTSAVLHPEPPEHNGTPDSAETRPKMVENPKGIFETPPGLELLSGGDGCQRECHSQSVLHVSMELSDSSIVSSVNANKTNTLNLDKTLDSVPDPRSSSTPMIDLKMFNLKTQRNEGQVLAAQKKLYPDGRSMPADQVPSEIPSNVPSNIVADRKTFLSQASSKLLWPPSMATSQLPKISNAYLGSKSTVPRKPEPLQSNLPMKRQRIQDAVKKPAPTEGPHRITEKQNSSSLSTRTAVFKLPASGIQRPQASKVTLVGKPAFPVRKLPTRINFQLLANADKPCGSKDAVKQLLSTESSSRILKPPAVKQKPLLTKPQRQGCSNCRVLEEQLKLKTEEIKRLQEELLTYTKKPKGSS